MAYLLDANVFIEAKNRYYGFDFCPAFWDWLVRAGAQGRVLSIDKVADELAGVADDLSSWAASTGHGLFRPIDASLFPALGQVSEWVHGQAYEAAAIATFLEVTDFYLIAYALTHGHTLVTHEVPSTSQKKIKIPNVCLGLGVKYTTTWPMLHTERARFVLGSSL